MTVSTTPSSPTTPRSLIIGIQSSISFDEDAKGCETAYCASAAYLLQANGFCTSCNTKAKLHSKLVRLGFQGSVQEVPSTPSGIARVHSQLTFAAPDIQPPSPTLKPPRPSIASSLAQQPEKGSAFDGRLTYNLVRRDSEGIPIAIGQQPQQQNVWRASSADCRSFRSEPPPAAVVDYQYLRLKFLLNKAIGQGVDPLEIFAHFDTDFSGEIDEDEFRDGLTRLGIMLTHAESLALLNRFSPSKAALNSEEVGGVRYMKFIEAMGLQQPRETSPTREKDAYSAIETSDERSEEEEEKPPSALKKSNVKTEKGPTRQFERQLSFDAKAMKKKEEARSPGVFQKGKRKVSNRVVVMVKEEERKRRAMGVGVLVGELGLPLLNTRRLAV
eukprot:CAMPEP_0171624928 /NCGR_PEP_ID=MMETSP0990-20121206/18962_1 /TAXON_ID=483369 /ORGANISM="non described non described, Strain CCMP2098" /LENGTH=385 /DNA_ID=CAMNT_0012191673 /DNA_START=299 /DNA_END=1457 /DNA_ORIENTATION=+